MESSILMIGQHQIAQESQQIYKGRPWKDITECCVNRVLYERLLNDPEEDFTGLGDTVTIEEPIYKKGFLLMPDGTKKEIYQESTRTTFSLVVVGIVEEEEYTRTEAFGSFHMYTSIDMVNVFLSKHDYNSPDFNDEAMFLFPQVLAKYAGDETSLYWRASADDPSEKEIRLPGGRILPGKEWLSYWENVPVNAGYIIEITLDSGKHYTDFIEYINQWFTENNARKRHDYNTARGLPDSQLLQEIADDDELDEWYFYPPIPRIFRPLRISGS